MKNFFKHKDTGVREQLKDLEAEFEAKGLRAGDRRTREWEDAVYAKGFINGREQGLSVEDKQGYRQGYKYGYADGKDSQRLGSRHTTRNQYPDVP